MGERSGRRWFRPPGLGAVYRRGRRWLSRAIVTPQRGLEERAVALTFDDGPHPTYTHLVLDVLAEQSTIATFFLVGRNAERHPELVRRILSEGHQIASHSLTHPDPYSLGTLALWRDYRDGRRAVEQAAGREIRLFRPPKGHVDLPESIAMRAAGLRPWLWTLDAADWEAELRPEDVCARLRPIEQGDVILLHDRIERPLAARATDRTAMVAGLRDFLGWALDEGHRFVPLR